MPNREEAGPNSWTEYRRLVMESLDRLAEENEKSKEELLREIREIWTRLNKFQIQITVEITALKTKASVWGAFFGAIVAAIVSIVAAILARK